MRQPLLDFLLALRSLSSVVAILRLCTHLPNRLSFFVCLFVCMFCFILRSYFLLPEKGEAKVKDRERNINVQEKP